jgi:drug/metabolite transporter (DMT)-like permease
MPLLFVIPFAIALIGARWLKIPKPILIGIAIAAISVIGVLVLWQVRGAGFDSMGGNCQDVRTRSFMEFTQLTFTVLAGALSAAAGLISGGLLKTRRIAGAIVSVVLLFASPGAAFLIVMASGMTAVDGYRC